MKILIVYASQHVGYDPVIPALKEALFVKRPLMGMGDDVRVSAYADSAFPPEALKSDWDMVILVDTLSWMLANRLQLIGRPWICMVSFSFASMLAYMKMPIADSGVHAVFSNCPAFVTQSSQQVPATFMWKPTELEWRGSPAGRPIKVGTVLPNVDDRDFSVLCEAARIFQELAPKSFGIYVRDTEHQRLPEMLEEFVIPYKDGDEIDAYQSIEYYLNAPRITDYRAGVTPPEALRAIACGCLPILVYHPALEPVKHHIQPLCHSYTQLKTVLVALSQATELTEPQVSVTLPEDMCVSVAAYAERLMLGHQRWRVNAAG